MDEDLKKDWRTTGDSLGKAFRDLGKTLILSTKTGMERAIDWAENAEYSSQTVETTAEDTETTGETAQAADAPQEQEVVSVAEEIRRLAQLRDEGILTEEEFQAKKQQLLGL